MIVQCKPVVYIDGIQLIIRPLHRLMNVRYKCCTELPSASVGFISKLNLRGHHLQNKVMKYSNFNVNVVKTLKLVFCFSCDGVPLKLDNKAKRFYSLSERIV
jgi:hypothetical protein